MSGVVAIIKRAQRRGRFARQTNGHLSDVSFEGERNVPIELSPPPPPLFSASFSRSCFQHSLSTRSFTRRNGHSCTMRLFANCGVVITYHIPSWGDRIHLACLRRRRRRRKSFRVVRSLHLFVKLTFKVLSPSVPPPSLSSLESSGKVGNSP